MSGGKDQFSNEQEPPQHESEEEVKDERENIEPPSKHNIQDTAQNDRYTMTDDHEIIIMTLHSRYEAIKAAEKARVIAEYQQRQREAAANKAKGHAQWRAPPVQLPPHTPAAAAGNVGAGGGREKSKAEEV